MKLHFKKRETGEAFADWPEYRIDTSDGITVATIHGSANQALGRCMAGCEELREALIDALICAREDGREGAAWYGFAVEALAAVGYDEYGDECEDTDAKD